MIDCKPLCDSDQRCQGYMEGPRGIHCQVATTSDCPSDCVLIEGSTGSLDPNAICGENSGMKGCYIKDRKS